MDRIISSLSNLLSGVLGDRPVFRNGIWSSSPLPYVELEDYAPSQSTDWTDAINAACTAAIARGRGDIIAPASATTFDIDGVVRIPDGVNLRGAGNGKLNPATHFRCTSAESQIRIGEVGVGSGTRGGLIGHFVIDGNDIAVTPLFIGRTVERTIRDIDVFGAAAGDAGCRIEEAQNLAVIGLNVEDNAGDNLVLDVGCGGLTFFRFEASGAGLVNVRFTQSRPSSAGVYSQPTDIVFYQPVIERHTETTECLVAHEAGVDNMFDHGTFAYSGTTTPLPMIVVSQDLGYASTRFHVRGGLFQGDTAYSTGIQVADSVVVFVLGAPRMSNLLSAFEISTAAAIYLDIEPFLSNVTNRTTGAGVAEQCIRVHQTATTLHTSTSASDTVEYYVVKGEAGARHRVNGTGSHQWGDGSSFTLDTTLSRRGANLLGMNDDDSFQVGDGTWNGGHLRFGAYHMWVDGSGVVRIKSSAPTSATDGTVVGSQT